jgi:hypothetical protein
MRTESEQDSDVLDAEREQHLRLPVPIRDGDLFKYGATADILGLLAQYPLLRFSLRDLSRRTEYSVNSVRSAVEVLEANDLVTVGGEGNATPVSVNRDRLHDPDNPVFAVPQPEFHLPVHVAAEKVHGELDDVAGIVLFGSVADGTADRRSDIDLWVLVEGDRLTTQQTANEVSKELSGVSFPSRDRRHPRLESASRDGDSVPWAATPEGVEDDGDPLELLPDAEDGDRYEFEIVVETPDSIRSRADDRINEILAHGLVLYRTETLSAVVSEVLANAR